MGGKDGSSDDKCKDLKVLCTLPSKVRLSLLPADGWMPASNGRALPCLDIRKIQALVQTLISSDNGVVYGDDAYMLCSVLRDYEKRMMGAEWHGATSACKMHLLIIHLICATNALAVL